VCDTAMSLPRELVCSTKDIDEIKTVSKLIYEFAVSVVRRRPLLTDRVDVIGAWLAIGWHARNGLAFVPDDVALGINTPLQDVCVRRVWRGVAVVARVLISWAKLERKWIRWRL
jgi:hypothetical protein